MKIYYMNFTFFEFSFPAEKRQPFFKKKCC